MSNTTGLNDSTEMTAGNRRNLLRISQRSSSLLVQVIACDGGPLNPCHPARARELIRKQRAIRISQRPYTIRLLNDHLRPSESTTSQQDIP